MQNLDLIGGPVSYPGVAEVRPGRDGGVVFSRMPRSERHLFVGMMAQVVRATSGVRAAFRTDSARLVVRSQPMMISFAGTDRPALGAAVDLAVDGELVDSMRAPGGLVVVVNPADESDVSIADEGEAVHEFSLRGGLVDVEIWLPQNGSCALLAIEVDDGSVVETASDDDRPKWVHYGSSISQCGEAHSPLRTWPAVAARLGGWNLTSLGFSGSCHLDQFVARHIRGLPADRISVKAGINIVGGVSMTQRTFAPAFHGFLDTVRDGHPNTPLVVASPIWCPFLETQPGPSRLGAGGVFTSDGDPADIAAGALSLSWIRDYVQDAVGRRAERGDANLHYVDGLDLFSSADAVDLPDDLHPNGDGYERIGQRWHALAG